MPGIAGPIWSYADLFCEMENGLLLRIVCGETGVINSLPKDVVRIKEKEFQKIEGVRSVINIYEGEEPCIYVLLDDGSHIEYSLQPGGSRWDLARFDESYNEDPDDDWEETMTSLVDGKSLKWSQFTEWYNKSGEVTPNGEPPL